ncbi:uncharacterized protein LOC113464160 [Ceratina calcarata]|uniref:Uncharacterized protein LOC113464160 n=1 Tax=Ceratina calcarata TaxID=156304 RepID=A0AAJ7RYN0_9HYME|nr:uncharacterized protein LOC113464160 [Ceratina calcarata]
MRRKIYDRFYLDANAGIILTGSQFDRANRIPWGVSPRVKKARGTELRRLYCGETESYLLPSRIFWWFNWDSLIKKTEAIGSTIELGRTTSKGENQKDVQFNGESRKI